MLFICKYEQTPTDIIKLCDITEFKAALKKHLAPSRYKFLAHGSKLGNKYLTQIRLGRSYLNDHSFQIQMTPSPQCSCNAARESTNHYFLDCKDNSKERWTMFGVFEQYLPKFHTYTKNKKLDIILNGFDRDSNNIYRTIVTLQYSVQNFVLKTKRFVK